MRKYLGPMVGAMLLAACATPDATEEATLIETAAESADVWSGAVDYSDTANWLCHPDKTESNACDQDLSATVVNADGSTSIETFTKATAPTYDCFYVYPTVSRDETPNSDLDAGPEELNVVKNQFARFGQNCRTFAPTYRQLTLPALRKLTTGGTFEGDREMNYRDVKNAWETYLATENDGRGVVLVGHSQGSGLIDRLIREEIVDNDEVRSLIISAMPIGISVTADADGNYPLPPCASKTDTSCMVSYVSFRAGDVPPPTSRFGYRNKEGGRSMCVNPVALSGGTLQSYMPTRSYPNPEPNAFAEGVTVETDLVKVPGLLSVSCASSDTHNWLSMSVNADPNDPRTDTVEGDVKLPNGERDLNWGLHLIDVNLAMGNLVDIADAQAAAWQAKQ